MKKPIEPGCLALIVGGDPSCIGRECVVIQWVERGGSFISGGELFGAISAGWAIDIDDMVGVWSEKWLRRIDGGEPETIESEEYLGVSG